MRLAALQSNLLTVRDKPVKLQLAVVDQDTTQHQLFFWVLVMALLRVQLQRPLDRFGHELMAVQELRFMLKNLELETQGG